MTKAEFDSILYADRERFQGKIPGIKDIIIHNESWFIYRYILHLRHLEYFDGKEGLPKLAKWWHFFRYKRLGFKLHLAIYPGTIGPGFRLYHIGDYTHVGPNVSIGKNCTMVAGVVFGNKTEREDNCSVFVGDNVYFGIGVKVIGPVRIGDNVTIGANAVITKDIPENTVVGGVPAKVIKYK